MKFLIIFTILLVFIVQIIESKPYQFLPPRKGWVPVYIREGDTPLEEIHPGLAEAFHEHAISTRKADHPEVKLNEEEGSGQHESNPVSKTLTKRDVKIIDFDYTDTSVF